MISKATRASVQNTNRTNAFNRLFQTTQLGQGAATGQAPANLLTGNQSASNTRGAGNAAGAAAFVDYVLSADGEKVLAQAGFAAP